MRILSAYLLLDSSGSMRGESIEAVKTSERIMMRALRQDPNALETLHVSRITWDAATKVVTYDVSRAVVRTARLMSGWRYASAAAPTAWRVKVGKPARGAVRRTNTAPLPSRKGLTSDGVQG